MITFRSIQPTAERDTVIAFFIDSANGEDDGGFDEEDYIKFAQKKADDLPEGFVFAEHDGNVAGELVLRVDRYEGREIGYVSLIYVVPEQRGTGCSQQMFAHAEDVFKQRGLREYHLRVSQTNPRAIRFYEKQGLVRLGEERNKRGQLCWRMGKTF